MGIRMLILAALLAATSVGAIAPPANGGRAEVVRRYPAPEARQGVAVGRDHIYAVANWTIAKYDKKTGAKLAEWKGDPQRFPHINSCTVIGRELVCASSNFPATPHWSAVEVFDARTLHHLRTVALGQGTGSVTWIERRGAAWYAAFANYDGKGGEAPRDHRHTTLVKFDDQWRRMEAWSFPETALARFAPMSSSGGGFGPDGRLWVTGHDHGELYVLDLPKGGAVLDHVATVQAPDIEGQAIDWDEGEPGMIYGISRTRREIVALRAPKVGK